MLLNLLGQPFPEETQVLAAPPTIRIARGAVAPANMAEAELNYACFVLSMYVCHCYVPSRHCCSNLVDYFGFRVAEMAS